VGVGMGMGVGIGTGVEMARGMVGRETVTGTEIRTGMGGGFPCWARAPG
jgi:hypothetical protein